MFDASKCRRQLIASIFGTFVGFLFIADVPGANAASVAVTVSGIVPNGTSVLVALCAGGLDAANCTEGERLVAQSGSMRAVFANVPPGRYAIAAYQDLNGSGNIERTGLGLPLEPYGLSNGAGQGRRPTFEAAAFLVKEGTTNVSVALRRMAQPAKE